MVDWTAAGDVAAGSEEVLHYIRDALGSLTGRLDTVSGVVLARCRSSEDVSRTARVGAAQKQRHSTTAMRGRRGEVRQCHPPRLVEPMHLLTCHNHRMLCDNEEQDDLARRQSTAAHWGDAAMLSVVRRFGRCGRSADTTLGRRHRPQRGLRRRTGIAWGRRRMPRRVECARFRCDRGGPAAGGNLGRVGQTCCSHGPRRRLARRRGPAHRHRPPGAAALPCRVGHSGCTTPGAHTSATARTMFRVRVHPDGLAAGSLSRMRYCVRQGGARGRARDTSV